MFKGIIRDIQFILAAIIIWLFHGIPLQDAVEAAEKAQKMWEKEEL